MFASLRIKVTLFSALIVFASMAAMSYMYFHASGAAADRFVDSVWFALLAGSLASIAIGMLTHHVTHGLRRLAAAARELAAGNFNADPLLHGEDEIGQLANAFRVMTDALRLRMGALRDSERRLAAIADYTYGIELWVSPKGRLLWVNPSVERMIGYTVAECMGRDDFPAFAVAPEDQARVLEVGLQALVDKSSREEFNFLVQHKDGRRFSVTSSWQPAYADNNEYLGVRVSVRDVERLRLAELKLLQTVTELQAAQKLSQKYLAQTRDEHMRLESLLRVMATGVLFVDPRGVVAYCNPAFAQIWRLEASPQGDLANAVLAKAAMRCRDFPEFDAKVREIAASWNLVPPFDVECSDGRIISVLSSVVPATTSDRFGGRLWLFEDVSQLRSAAQQLLKLAERDALTGLFNRRRFESESTRMLAEAQRRSTQLALLLFDLDGFKFINDRYGHQAGDAMLCQVARTVEGQVRKNDICCRIGGDEFVVLALDASEESMLSLAERIARAISRTPVEFESQKLFVSTSIGIAFYPAHALDSTTLHACADQAMYQAKRAGKNAWRCFQPQQVARAPVAVGWADRIDKALERNLFALEFQPVFQLAPRRLAHYEALLRMVDEARDAVWIGPEQFIPAAERTNRIHAIDRWVLASAIDRLARQPMLEPIAVNMSARSLEDPSLPRHIADQLSVAGVQPQRLLIELTESSAVVDLPAAERFIGALREIGCRVCLDDFGTGFSSFAYLKQLRADVVKIDQLFITDLARSRKDQIVVRSLAEVARGFGIASIAEAVEDEATLSLLRSFGIDMAQGNFLAPPSTMASDAAPRLTIVPRSG
jgi:diguanylate cyclase (GGDEF)-like protein/PAS domain S-box-containing protein